MTKRPTRYRWSDLSPAARTGVVIAGIVQIGLISIAHADLMKRPDDQVRGPKRMWRWITLVNFVGPLAYFTVGRRDAAEL